MKKIGIIVGSTRVGSNSSKVADNLVKILEGKAKVTLIAIDKLPLYSQDSDVSEKAPRVYTTFRKAVAKQDRIIIVTPEHNRTMPAALKNALDIGSRPWGQSVWGDKNYLIVANSIGKLSAFGARNDVHKVLSFLNGRIMNQPEVYLGPVHEVFTQEGIFVPDTLKFMTSVMDAFIAFK